MPKVRRAKPDDVAAVAAIHVRSWQAAYSGILPEDVLAGLSVTEREESWRHLLADPEHHWLNLVAEDGGVIVGFCAVTTPSWDALADERLAEVGALYVDPVHWREGIGSALLRSALAELEEDAWSEVLLWVLPENHRAPRLLRSLRLPCRGRSREARGAKRPVGDPAASAGRALTSCLRMGGRSSA